MKKSPISKQTQWFSNNCKTGKRVYIDRSAAKAAAKNIQKRGGGNLRPYQCKHCGYQWHIGHPWVIPPWEAKP